MSGGLEVLNLKEDDVTKMLTACTHIGSDNVDYQMEQYVYKRRPDGKNMFINEHRYKIYRNHIPMLMRQYKFYKMYSVSIIHVFGLAVRS